MKIKQVIVKETTEPEAKATTTKQSFKEKIKKGMYGYEFVRCMLL